jgi:branched-chain amino acid transport system ATP-binding protein
LTAVLEARSLTVRYGGVVALADADIEVGEGELVGLIGPNGAGKTTFTDAVTGFTPAAGQVHLDGLDISRLHPHQRLGCGLARTWQAGELFDDLTVRENLAVAAGKPSVGQALAQIIRGRPAERPELEEILDLLGLSELADRQADSISQGQRKLVGVARALASSPKVVCLDEPGAGLDTAESEALGKRLKQVTAKGIGLLLIDHDMGLVLGICDRVVVLDFGKVIAGGTPEQVRKNPAVIDAYLGGAAARIEEGTL